jgi:transcription antitermination factor NusB
VPKSTQRRKAREVALQALYTIDLMGEEASEQIEEFIRSEGKRATIIEFAGQLVRGSLKNIKSIDKKLARAALNWEISRMAVIDRNILRLGAYELLFCPDIPPKVAMNEAIELAKKFGSKDSAPFVNGILDKLYKEERGNEASR